MHWWCSSSHAEAFHRASGFLAEQGLGRSSLGSLWPFLWRSYCYVPGKENWREPAESGAILPSCLVCSFETIQWTLPHACGNRPRGTGQHEEHRDCQREVETLWVFAVRILREFYAGDPANSPLCCCKPQDVAWKTSSFHMPLSNRRFLKKCRGWALILI